MHGKVLIIDPITTNRIILKVKFSAAYYTVTQALTLAEAIAVIAKSRPNIAITADQLPDGTARELISQMHELPMGHDIPIIAIESYQNLDNQLPLLEAGIDVVLC
jgi:two-component system cell cycle response regulator